jgi:phosphopantetheinyl transferase
VSTAAEGATLCFVESWRKTITADLGRAAGAQRFAADVAVNVWIARVEPLLQAQSSLDVLTDDDRSELARLKAPAARNCATAARLLLRLGLSRTVKGRVAPHDWRFRRNSAGKPALSNPRENIGFSVSHTNAVIAVAISSKSELGIDIESVDQDLVESVIENFCSQRERKILRACPPAKRTREFIQLWTRKEAYAKLLGRGHAIDFSSVECPADPAGIQRDDRSSSAVLFESFYVPVDHSLYYASLAVKKPDARSLDIQLINVIGSGRGAAAADATDLPVLS